MAQKRSVKSEKTFMEKLAEKDMKGKTDHQIVNIRKKNYLIKNKENILNAHKEGYSFVAIADVATSELLEEDNIPRSYIVNKPTGDEERDTKFESWEIKNFYESEEVGS